MTTLYATVFLSSFLAATVIPFSSEVAVAGAVAAGAPAIPLVAVATVGNTLGAVVGWGIGRLLLAFRDRPWFPAGPAELERASRWFRRYGIWSLLLAWVPLAGDALTVIAGALRVRLDLFCLLVGIGKGIRYAVVVGLLGAVLGTG